jgi:8-oxo-dGTP diphosphatase
MEISKKKKGKRITVTAAILLREETIFIGKRKNIGALPGKWEFPGGKVEPGETPEACLKRELKEELGIDAEVGDLLWEGQHTYDFATVHLLVYRAYWNGSKVASSDHDETQWAPLDRLFEYDFAPADWPLVKRLVKKGLTAV